MNGKQRKEAKKLEKKKRAEERHKLKFNGGMKTPLSDDEDVHTVVATDMAMMRIWYYFVNCSVLLYKGYV